MVIYQASCYINGSMMMADSWFCNGKERQLRYLGFVTVMDSVWFCMNF